MPLTPTRENPLPDIYAAMIALEQPYFANLDANFNAYDYLPGATPGAALRYPLTFRVAVKGGPQDRTMGNGSSAVEQPTDTDIVVYYLVGLSSQAFGSLSRQADLAIRPFHELYIANRSISGTVYNITLGQWEQGDWEFNSVKHYGIGFPITVHQKLHMTSKL